MPVQTLTCPTCKRCYNAYVDANTVIACSNCQTVFNAKGEALPTSIVVNPVSKVAEPSSSIPEKDQQHTVKPQPPPTSNVGMQSALFIMVAIIFIIVVVAIRSLNNNPTLKPEQPYIPTDSTATGAAPVNSPQSNTNSVDSVASTSPPAQPVESAPVTVDSIAAPSLPADEVARVNLVNTYSGINKTLVCKVKLNEADLTLTLQPVNNPLQLITLTYQGNAVYNLKMYYNDELEADKVVYRRSDLETGEDRFVYSSNTGELTVKIKNN